MRASSSRSKYHFAEREVTRAFVAEIVGALTGMQASLNGPIGEQSEALSGALDAANRVFAKMPILDDTQSAGGTTRPRGSVDTKQMLAHLRAVHRAHVHLLKTIASWSVANSATHDASVHDAQHALAAAEAECAALLAPTNSAPPGSNDLADLVRAVFGAKQDGDGINERGEWVRGDIAAAAELGHYAAMSDMLAETYDNIVQQRMTAADVGAEQRAFKPRDDNDGTTMLRALGIIAETNDTEQIAAKEVGKYMREDMLEAARRGIVPRPRHTLDPVALVTAATRAPDAASPTTTTQSGVRTEDEEAQSAIAVTYPDLPDSLAVAAETAVSYPRLTTPQVVFAFVRSIGELLLPNIFGDARLAMIRARAARINERIAAITDMLGDETLSEDDRLTKITEFIAEDKSRAWWESMWRVFGGRQAKHQLPGVHGATQLEARINADKKETRIANYLAALNGERTTLKLVSLYALRHSVALTGDAERRSARAQFDLAANETPEEVVARIAPLYQRLNITLDADRKPVIVLKAGEAQLDVDLERGAGAMLERLLTVDQILKSPDEAIVSDDAVNAELQQIDRAIFAPGSSLDNVEVWRQGFNGPLGAAAVELFFTSRTSFTDEERVARFGYMIAYADSVGMLSRTSVAGLRAVQPLQKTFMQELEEAVPNVRAVHRMLAEYAVERSDIKEDEYQFSSRAVDMLIDSRARLMFIPPAGTKSREVALKALSDAMRFFHSAALTQAYTLGEALTVLALHEDSNLNAQRTVARLEVVPSTRALLDASQVADMRRQLVQSGINQLGERNVETLNIVVPVMQQFRNTTTSRALVDAKYFATLAQSVPGELIAGDMFAGKIVDFQLSRPATRDRDADAIGAILQRSSVQLARTLVRYETHDASAPPGAPPIKTAVLNIDTHLRNIDTSTLTRLQLVSLGTGMALTMRIRSAASGIVENVIIDRAILGANATLSVSDRLAEMARQVRQSAARTSAVQLVSDLFNSERLSGATWTFGMYDMFKASITDPIVSTTHAMRELLLHRNTAKNAELAAAVAFANLSYFAWLHSLACVLWPALATMVPALGFTDLANRAMFQLFALVGGQLNARIQWLAVGQMISALSLQPMAPSQRGRFDRQLNALRKTAERMQAGDQPMAPTDTDGTMPFIERLRNFALQHGASTEPVRMGLRTLFTSLNSLLSWTGKAIGGIVATVIVTAIGGIMRYALGIPHAVSTMLFAPAILLFPGMCGNLLLAGITTTLSYHYRTAAYIAFNMMASKVAMEIGLRSIAVAYEKLTTISAPTAMAAERRRANLRRWQHAIVIGGVLAVDMAPFLFGRQFVFDADTYPYLTPTVIGAYGTTRIMETFIGRRVGTSLWAANRGWISRLLFGDSGTQQPSAAYDYDEAVRGAFVSDMIARGGAMVLEPSTVVFDVWYTVLDKAITRTDVRSEGSGGGHSFISGFTESDDDDDDSDNDSGGGSHDRAQHVLYTLGAPPLRLAIHQWPEKPNLRTVARNFILMLTDVALETTPAAKPARAVATVVVTADGATQAAAVAQFTAMLRRREVTDTVAPAALEAARDYASETAEMVRGRYYKSYELTFIGKSLTTFADELEQLGALPGIIIRDIRMAFSDKASDGSERSVDDLFRSTVTAMLAHDDNAVLALRVRALTRDVDVDPLLYEMIK